MLGEGGGDPGSGPISAGTLPSLGPCLPFCKTRGVRNHSHPPLGIPLSDSTVFSWGKYVGLPLGVRNETPKNRLMAQIVVPELPSHGTWILSVSPPLICCTCKWSWVGWGSKGEAKISLQLRGEGCQVLGEMQGRGRLVRRGLGD